jgi:hypothetical protein
MAPGVTTHGTEMQARHVELSVTGTDSSGLNAVSPPSPNVAPPGWYMLFLVTSDGVPSVARWVHVAPQPDEPDPPDPPPGLPHFGTLTRVSVVGDRFTLDHNKVTIRVRNANGFDVPLRMTIRLKGKNLQGVIARPKSVEALARRHRTIGVLAKLGRHRAGYVRRRGHAKALVRLFVRDPRGNERVVKRTVTLLAP